VRLEVLRAVHGGVSGDAEKGQPGP
jgi:hypothetical protein